MTKTDAAGQTLSDINPDVILEVSVFMGLRLFLDCHHTDRSEVVIYFELVLSIFRGSFCFSFWFLT